MAGEDKLTPSGLEKLTYQRPGWNYVITRNFEIIDYILQQYQRLGDVDQTVLPVKNSVMKYNAASKFVPYEFPRYGTTTTTTTTTTSSSTSTSSSSSSTTTTTGV